MNSMQIGAPLPALTLAATDGQTLHLPDFCGKPLILYFYPKDNTPGCTQEGQDFREAYALFQQLGAQILGVSRDSARTHDNFKAKYELPFALLADTEEALCAHFNVIRAKKMYGKDVRGIERSTFLFNSNGLLAREWRKVKVEGHVDEVLAALKELA